MLDVLGLPSSESTSLTDRVRLRLGLLGHRTFFPRDGTLFSRKAHNGHKKTLQAGARRVRGFRERVTGRECNSQAYLAKVSFLAISTVSRLEWCVNVISPWFCPASPLAIRLDSKAGSHRSES
jgi:hypothetical protein